jgi:hypothetical protein
MGSKKQDLTPALDGDNAYVNRIAIEGNLIKERVYTAVDLVLFSQRTDEIGIN